MKILLYPHELRKTNKVWHYLNILGYEWTNNPIDSFDIVLYWSYNTFNIKDKILVDIEKEYRIINIGCMDVSKTKVESTMLDVFGYNSIINPFEEKLFVEKFEIQSKKKYSLKEKIDKKKKGYIYTKLIDSKTNEDTFIEYRCYLFNHRIYLILVLEQYIKNRFKTEREKVNWIYIRHPQFFFTRTEINKIGEFSKTYPIDFTELDIMRDQDGKLYIIDNNNVSGITMNPSDYKRSMKILVPAFDELLQNFKN